LAAKSQLVQDWYGLAAAKKWCGYGDRPRHRSKKNLIEQAYQIAEEMGIAV
jgi:hypothetical protein